MDRHGIHSASSEVGMVFLYRNLIRVHAMVMSELGLKFGQRVDERTFAKILQGNLAVGITQQTIEDLRQTSRQWDKRAPLLGPDAGSDYLGLMQLREVEPPTSAAPLAPQ